MQILDRLWRALGTALFLSIIAVGGSLLAITVFPAIMTFVRRPERQRRVIQLTLHHTFRVYCAALNVLRLANVTFEGTGPLRDLKGHLIIANHPSLLDVVMIMACVPDVQCIVKARLWSHPFFGLTMRGAGFIRNDLPTETLLQCCRDSLDSGQNLIIFPEGTRTTPNTAPKPQRGFANLALYTGADIQMITITCDPPILFKGNPWWRVPKRRSDITLSVGERLSIKPFLTYAHRSIGARKLTAFVEDYYRRSALYG